MKKNKFRILIVFLILISSCIEDSPLSDLELVDPSLIKPEIILEREWDNNGHLTTEITVFLWDKNSNTIVLEKGSVSVNGHTMQVKELVLTEGSYYTIDNEVVKVELDQLYTFVIELADGKQYEASITTQDIDLYELNLPPDYKKENDMEINWQGHDVLNDFQIHLMCRYATNPGSGLTNNSFIPNQQERANGSYIISKSYFNQEEEIYEALVFMNSQKKGTIDSRFRDYSKITSTFKIDSKCDVN